MNLNMAHDISSMAQLQSAPQGEIVLYQPDETIRLEVRLENDTVWLTQFGRICNPAAPSIRTCSPLGALQMLILYASGLQIRSNGKSARTRTDRIV